MKRNAPQRAHSLGLLTGRRQRNSWLVNWLIGEWLLMSPAESGRSSMGKQMFGVVEEKGLIRLGVTALSGVWPKASLYGTIARS
jgi:hypothetical protein